MTTDRSSMFLRFPLSYRIEHWVLAINFAILAITGLAQFGAETAVAQWTIGILGGVENTRKIHHDNQHHNLLSQNHRLHPIHSIEE